MRENLTAIIPFWNGHATLARLLNSLPADLPVIVVNDLGSKPPVVARPQTQVLNLKTRGYFAGACNAGFAACTTDVLILNQDLYFTNDQWLASIDLAQKSGWSIYGDGVLQHPAWPVGYVQGTFMFISRSTLEATGNFNETLYPLWGATAEFQLRACRAGCKAVPVEKIPGMGHERRQRYGSAIETALGQEPEKKSLFIHTPPEISVIIPCYNYGRYLKAAVDSLMRQTLQSFEVIIVDDKSTDDSLAIAKSLQSYEKGIRVLWHSTNQGTATTINSGIKAAYGKYITTLSADDTLEPYSLERHWQAQQTHPHSFTYGDIFFVNGEKREVIKMQAFNYDQLLKRNHVPAGIMYLKKAWEEAGGYPAIMNDGREDWAFAIGLGRVGYCGVHIGQTGYLVRREKQNRSLRNQSYGINYFLNKIKSVYPDVYAGGCTMCCGQGGKSKTAQPSNKIITSNPTALNPQGGFTWLTYIGANVGTETLYTPSGNKYKYGRSARRLNVLVSNEDVDFVLGTQMFKRTKIAPKAAVVQEVTPAIVSEVVAAPGIDLSDGVSKEEASLAGQALAAYESEMPQEPETVYASKAALKLADDNGIAIALVTGTGKDGQITKNDVQQYLDAH